MGIKTPTTTAPAATNFTLKNLPTTWGLRPLAADSITSAVDSEKPPHHMGIKTRVVGVKFKVGFTLKNLPTTWGLRH